MIGTALAAAIDRRDGDSGVKGAFCASGATNTRAKLGIFAAIGAGAIGLAKRASK